MTSSILGGVGGVKKGVCYGDLWLNKARYLTASNSQKPFGRHVFQRGLGDGESWRV